MVRSWTVFHENNGHITLRIKFMPTSNSVKRIEQPQFRRKSDRQVDRDARRSQQWRSESYAATPADHPGQLDTITPGQPG